MRIYSHFVKVILFLFIVLGLTSCGYKPSAKYSREVVGEKISTSVIISAQDPENTVVIKDAVDSAIIEVFHASLVARKYAQTHLSFSITEPQYTPIQYNSDGYVISYRATINLGIIRTTKAKIKKYNSQGTYDFSVVPNAVLTDKERFDAIKFSSIKAIASFVAQISAEGSRK